MSIIDDFKKQSYEEGYADGKRDAVVHGHWMKQRVSYFHELLDYTAKCSICLDVPDENMTYDGIKIMWKYCPVCGAKMDEVTE